MVMFGIMTLNLITGFIVGMKNIDHVHASQLVQTLANGVVIVYHVASIIVIF